MELVKTKIHDYKIKNKSTIQITLDDDFNVPDAKPDIDQIVKERGRVHIDSLRVNDDKVEVSGNLQFAMLYMSGMPVCMSGHMDFNEKVNCDNLDGSEVTFCEAEIEDLTIKAINSRKVSLKAIITLTVISEKLEDEEIASDWDDMAGGFGGAMMRNANVQTRKRDVDICQSSVNLKDTFRIKEEFEIPSGRPNINELLWYDATIKSFDCRPGDNSLNINGELCVFVLFTAADDSGSVQWYENTSAFDGSIDVSGCDVDMISYVNYKVSSCDVEVKPDFDGEDRNISIEMVLDLDIKAFEEKKVTLMDDIYSPTKCVSVETKPCTLRKLMIRNNSKCRVNDRIKVNSSIDIMQICNCTGVAKLDDVSISEDGVDVDGVVLVNVFYVASNDNMPMGCVKGAIPFHHKIEIKNKNCRPEDMQCNINVNLEQLNAVMAGSDEIEIKAVICLNTICFELINETAIESAKISDVDDARYFDIPSVVGYIAKENDTLWDIAKKFHTTIDHIKVNNRMSSDKVNCGDKMILVKCEK